MMIEAESWWAILEAYNVSMYPLQFVMYALAAIVTVVFFVRPGRATTRLVQAYFALAFAWIGIVFFMVLGQTFPAHNAQAFLFVALALVFAVESLINRIEFKVPKLRWLRATTVAALVLTFLYPVVGLLVGHVFPRSIIPGIFPCPTVALVLVFMSTTLPNRKPFIYYLTLGLLLLWAIPFPIFFQIPQFGVYEDGIMLVIGLYSLIVLPIKLKSARRSRTVQDSVTSAG